MTPSLPVTRLSSCRRAAAARRSRRRVACLLALLAASGLTVNQAAAQDTAAPAVSDLYLSSFPPSDATYQRGDTITVRVDFDNPVAVTGTPQVGVAIGGQTRAASLSRFAGSRSRAWTLFFGYQVQSADSDTDGVSIAADAIGLNGGTIKDADDDTTDAVLTHAAVAADADHQVDGSRFDVPAVSAVSFVGSPANGDTYQLGETIEVKVEFDRFVTNTGRPSPQVALTIGSETRLADFDHGRGRGGITDLHFEYEVQAGDRDTDGIGIAADSIRRNGASIRAAADGTTDADLTHAAVADDASRKVAGSAVTAPAVNDIHVVGYPDNGVTYLAGETIPVRVFFDRSVNVTGSPQLELTIGGNIRLATSSSSQNRVGVAGLQFDYTVRAGDRDPDGISIAANAIRLNGGTITATDGTTDADLQHAALAADPRRTVGVSQVTGPLVTFVYFSSSAASGEYYQHGETIEVTVRFGEAVTVTGTPQVALSVGSHTRQATYSAADSSNTEIAFGYTVQASDRDLDGVSIPANALSLDGGTIKDAGGTTDAVLTHGAVAAASRRKVDGKTTAPVVSSISFTGAPAAGDTYIRGETIAVRVEFDRPVAVTGNPQVALAIGNHSRAAAFSSISLGVTASFTYTVQQADLDADGIGIAAGALSRNGATIKAAADGTTNAVLTHAAVAAAAGRKVDGSRVVAPAVTGISFAGAAPGGGSYRSGQTIWVEVGFSRPVTVTGSPLVELDIGAHTRSASFFSVRAGTAARFEYTVQAADADADGVSIAADAIRRNGGTIKGADGVTDAVLTHAAVAADPRRRVGSATQAAGPVVSRLFFSSYPASGDTYQFGEAIRVEVVFDRAVTVSGNPQLALTIGSATRAAGFVGGSDTGITTLSFEYVVQAADRDLDGIGIAADALALNGGTITAAGGSGAADLTHAALPTDTVRKVDGGQVSTPAVSSIYFASTPANGTTYELGDTIRVTLQFDRAVTATGTPQVALAIGTRSRLANYHSSHARFLFFDYQVQAADLDSDGIGIAANALSLNGGSIAAAAADATAAELTHAAVAVTHGVDGSSVTTPAVSHVAFAGSPVNGDTYLRGETIAVRVVFNRTVAVTGSPQVELTVGGQARAATYSSGTRSLTFAYTVQADDRDVDGVSIAADAIRLNGGAITAVDGTTAADPAHLRVAASLARRVDGSRSRGPTVSAIAFSGRPAGGDTYELGETIAVSVVFDSPVTVAGAPRVQVTVGSRARHATFSSAARSAVKTLSFEYTVQADDRDADGIGIPANAIGLDGGSITDSDSAGIDAILGHAPVPADGTRKVDGSRVTTPAVSAISFAGRPAGGDTYVRGERIRVAVAFDRRVTVSGSPQVALLIDSGSRSAAFASADAGGTAVYFEYPVQAQDLDPDGIAIAADAIALNGGSIQAADGVTDAALSHAALAVDATRKVDGRIAGPLVSSIAFTGAPLTGGTYQRGENIDVRVEFSQPITYAGRPYVELSIGSRTRPAAFAYVPGPAALAFRYIVVSGDLDPDGVAIAADAIRLDGGSIKAADGVTPAILAHPAVAADPNRKVDGNQATAPAVSAIAFVDSPANGDSYQLGETIEVKVVFDRYVAFSGSPRVALTIGGQTGLASLSYGRGSGGITDLHFKYVVQERDFDADGIGIPADAIRLDGGSITARDRSTAADLRHAALADDATRRVDGIAVTGPVLNRIALFGVPAGGDAYQRGETIKVQVGFDRLVTVAGSPEVELTIGSRTARATLSSYGVGVRALGFEYPVQALDADADGIAIAANAIRLNGGSITATDGTTPALLTHAAVADDLSRKVGAVTAPAADTALSSIFISSSPAGGDTYERGETIEVRVVFNGYVTAAGSPQVELAVGDATRAATFWGTHFGRTLSFRYLVQAVDRDADGIAIAADAIRLDGGSIKAADGTTDALLTHAVVAAAPDHQVDGGLVTPPAVTAVSIASRPRGGAAYVRREAIVVEVGFSEPVAVTGAPQLALTVGVAARSAGFVRSTGRSLWFRYRAQENDLDDDGIDIAAGALTLNGGSIRDRTGNDARLDLGANAVANAAGHRVDASLVDTVAPAVTAVAATSAPQSGSTFVLGETIEIEVRFSEAVTVTGAPRLTLTLGSGQRHAAYAWSRQQVVRFRYVVQEGDSGALGIPADGLSLNGGTILDAGGNAALLSLGSTDLALGYAASGVRRDEEPPTVSNVLFESLPANGAVYERGDSVLVAVRFSEPVTVTGMPQLALAVGSATRAAAFDSSEQEYVRFRYTVQEQDHDSDGIGVAAEGITLNGGAIVDGADNPAQFNLKLAAIGSGHPVDGGETTDTVPTRAAVTSEPRSGDTYGRGESVDVEVEFTKEVTVSGQPLLELTIGSDTAAAAARGGRLSAAQAGTGTPVKRFAAFVDGANERLRFRYVVQAEDRSQGGRITIAADALRLNGARITDAAGAPVGAGNLRLDQAEVVHGDLVDGAMSEPALPVRVAVTSVPQADRTYRAGEDIVIEVQFSRGVTVTGAPQLELALGGAGAPAPRASYISAHDDTIRFRYAVQAGDRDADGIGIPAGALQLNDATIVDVLGEAVTLGLQQAQLILPADKVDGSAADATPPAVRAVAIVSRPAAAGYAYGDRVSVQVAFSEPVAVTGSPQLELAVGSASRLAGIAPGTGAARAALEFVYTVQVGDRDPDGIAIPADALQLNGGTIRDGAGNDADLRSSEVQPSAQHAVDPGVRLGCKPPRPVAARAAALAAAGTSGGLADYDHELTLELEENRAGSEQAVVLGCVALADADRQFSYALTAGNDGARFALGAADGLLSYVGPGEDAERTREYLLTVTATPADGSTALTLQVRVAVADADDRGAVTLSTGQPLVGVVVTARLADQDGALRDQRWQWRRRRAPDGAWSDIAAATDSRYEAVAADAGHSLQARVTYIDAYGRQHAASAPTAAVDLDPKRRERMLQLGLAGFGRSVAAGAVRVIGQRFTAALPAGEEDPWQVQVTLNRRSLHPDGADGAAGVGAMARDVAEALGVQATADGALAFDPVAGARLLSESAFRAERGHGAGRWGFWGSGDLSRFQGTHDGFAQKGTVVAGYLGADYRFTANVLAGFAASYSSLDLTSESEAADDATLQGYLVNAYPYAFWMPADWLGLWGLAGFGIGAAELADAGASREGHVRTWLGAAGQRTDLFSVGGFSLALKSDGFITGVNSGGGLPATAATAWRARLLLEGGLEWRPGDSRLAGSVAAGGRLDGGDAERGFGAEGEAELSYTHGASGLGLAGSGRLLLAHEHAGLRDWGASATLSWRPPGLGLALSAAPRWDGPATALASWWLPAAVDLRLSYRLELLQGAGRLVPFAEIGFEDSATRRVRAGAAIDLSDRESAHALELQAYGQRTAAPRAAPSYQFGFGGSVEY